VHWCVVLQNGDMYSLGSKLTTGSTNSKVHPVRVPFSPAKAPPSLTPAVEAVLHDTVKREGGVLPSPFLQHASLISLFGVDAYERGVVERGAVPSMPPRHCSIEDSSPYTPSFLAYPQPGGYYSHGLQRL
jgi:hypothetical protein